MKMTKVWGLQVLLTFAIPQSNCLLFPEESSQVSVCAVFQGAEGVECELGAGEGSRLPSNTRKALSPEPGAWKNLYKCCVLPYPFPLQGNEMERMSRELVALERTVLTSGQSDQDWSLSLSMGEPSSAAGGYVEGGLQELGSNSLGCL